jgi:hypothetical protein
MKIKLSNKLLLIAGSVPILFIVIMLFVFKFFLWDGGNSQASSTSNVITNTLPLEDFKELTINGISSVNIFRGDTCSVKITAPKDEMKKIKGEKNGTMLSLDFTSDPKSSTGLKPITAEIMLPEANTIHIQRATKIDLSGLKIKSLFITAQGPVKVTGKDAIIQDLQFNNAGATSIALSTVPVTNAELYCQGVYSINLMMNGGRLSGDIGGIGSFDYQGTVSVNVLRVNGSSNNMAYHTK